MVAFLQADVFHFGALLEHQRAAFHFQVFEQHHAVAVGQRCAVGINCAEGVVCFDSGIGLGRPFVGAFGANEVGAVFIGVFGLSLRAGREGSHSFSLWF